MVAAALVAAIMILPSAVAATANVGLDASGGLQLDGDRVALLVSEARQGGLDRNGDGDAIDQVLAVYNAATNTTVNVGLDASGGGGPFDPPGVVDLDGDRVAFTVSEPAQGGLDRNGDGDATDEHVLAVYNAATNTTANVGLDAASGNLQLDGDRVAFGVYEPTQGGLDRNGDGDASDFVLAVYNAATNTTANVGLAAGNVHLDGDRVAFDVYEPAQAGLDRNGDGDASDFVLAVYNAATNTTANVGLAAGDAQLDGGLVAFLVIEGAQGGLDRNGDGDAIDLVLAVYNAATNTTVNVGLDAFAGFQLGGDQVAFLVYEARQGGLDRNGDGDAVDQVFAIYDAATNTTVNVGLDASVTLQLDGDRVAFTVSEGAQGGLDRNGDGDAGDFVAAVYDAATNTTANVGLDASIGFQLDGDLVAFPVREASQGGVDRNGDGDGNDYVLAVYDAAANTTANVGLVASVGFQLDGDLVAFPVSEPAQGNLDRNDDGDALDDVLAVYDTTTNTTANVGLDAGTFKLDGDRVAFTVWEAAQGGLDRNGDGDTGDFVLAVWSDVADATAPTTTIALDPTTPDGQSGWYISDVAVTVAATDGAGGSGVAETRCVLDPAIAPATFHDVPAGCAYTGAGADVTTNGMHTFYAASKDVVGNEETPVSASFKIDQTSPTVTCDVDSPGPVFLLSGSGGNVSATVTDATSGPASASESAAASVATVGNRTVSLTGEDNAGNATDLDCPYRVSYRFLGFQGLKPSYERHRSIRVRFKLANAGGTTIPDSAAQALLTPCRAKVTVDGVEPTACALYNAKTNTFYYDVKTAELTVGKHALAIRVSAPDGSGVVNTNGTKIRITN